MPLLQCWLSWAAIEVRETRTTAIAMIFTHSLLSDELHIRKWGPLINCHHYNDVIMGTMASQITSLTIVYSTVSSDADQRKHQSSASLAFVRGIHRGPVNSPHKWPVSRKMFPFDDVIMTMLIFVHQARRLSGTRPSANHADCVSGHRNQIYHELTKESEGTCRTHMPIFSSPFVQLSSISHLPLDKMAAISQTTYSNAFFMKDKFCILIRISLKFVPMGPIGHHWFS